MGYKILGQSQPGTVLTDLYTVPASTSTLVGSLVVCNTGTTTQTFRVSTAIAGAADSILQYCFYEQNINTNETLMLNPGISLNATDKIRCYASNTAVIFNLYGLEIPS